MNSLNDEIYHTILDAMEEGVRGPFAEILQFEMIDDWVELPEYEAKMALVQQVMDDLEGE